MELQENILTFMRNEAYKPLSAEDLAEEMGLKAKELEEFWQVLADLESNADIIKTRFGKYGVPERMNLIVGRYSASSKGFGFVVSANPEEEDVFIPPADSMDAMHNDRVVARVHHRRASVGKAFEGEIIRIVKRANTQIVGTYEGSKHYGFVAPDDTRLTRDIFIPKTEVNGAKTGSKVVVEITEWPQRRKSAEGKIIEVLGQKGDPGIEILSIIKNSGLPTDFPPEVKAAAEKAPETISPAELEGRRDLRDKVIVTIDGEDAKDLDDAVHVERLKNGHYRLGVHIADVSHYVQENSPLDQEARARGTSVYLADRVIPMLPQRLSNGICSLNPRVDRLTLSAVMEINHDGQVVHYEIFPSIIKTHTRLSYTIVRKILAEQDEELRREYAELVPHLEQMERLCRILRERRLRRGAIDFDFPEVKVKLDEEGKPLEIVRRVRTIAESIVEEFMLVANETVAEHMHRLKVPFVFRVHEEPDSEKMSKLNSLLNNFGQQLSLGSGEIHPMALQKVLNGIVGRPEERIISTVMLRSLKQAHYEAENLGHFGLAAKYYTHFTSPIRRYPDLIVHRLIRETFNTGDISAKRRQKLAQMLPEIALHCSQRERAAAEAERDTLDLKKAEYMAQFVGEEFPGIISSVTAFGIFVELDNGVEGLVHVSSMDDDYYHYVEEQYSLIGERSRNVYRLGEPVKIVVAKVNPEERNIDFVLVTEGGHAVSKIRAGLAQAAKAGKTSKMGKTEKTAKPKGRGRGRTSASSKAKPAKAAAPKKTAAKRKPASRPKRVKKAE